MECLMPYRLEGQSALVTGGGTGIGAAVARSLSRAGASVFVAGRRAEPLQAIADEIGGHALALDVTDAHAVELAFKNIVLNAGSIDILVNNAGQSGPIGRLQDVDLKAWRDCIDVNLMGAMHCMRFAAAHMTRQGSGTIINMSSRMGLQGYPMRTAYCATKFALIGMTEALAREIGPSGVRVNAICPGAVSGELMDRVVARRSAAEGRPPEAIIRENYTDVAALRRWVDPEDVAETVLFLASEAGRNITAQAISVDAGRF
ncbi:MAG: SDR family oxidoreductase [Pseudomonadota bacterium]